LGSNVICDTIQGEEVNVVPLLDLAQTFLKIGALGFGGPFSLLAIMQKEVVERRKWLTVEDFTQSIGIGTITPGPIFFAAAIFIGYRLRGIRGAALCGLSVLLPSFLLVIGIATLYAEVEQSPWATAISRGIAAGVVGLFASVVLKTGRATIADLKSGGLVVGAFIALALFKIDPLLLIVVAGIGGAWFLRPAHKTQVEK
jgi:chromate transporter